MDRTCRGTSAGSPLKQTVVQLVLYYSWYYIISAISIIIVLLIYDSGLKSGMCSCALCHYAFVYTLPLPCPCTHIFIISNRMLFVLLLGYFYVIVA